MFPLIISESWLLVNSFIPGLRLCPILDRWIPKTEGSTIVYEVCRTAAAFKDNGIRTLKKSLYTYTMY